MSWRQLARLFVRDLILLAVLAAVLAAVSALLQLAAYGHVRW